MKESVIKNKYKFQTIEQSTQNKFRQDSIMTLERFKFKSAESLKDSVNIRAEGIPLTFLTEH